MGQHKANAVRQRRRMLLDLYAAGHSLEVIAGKTGYSPKKAAIFLRRAGVVVDPERIDKPAELKESAQ